MLIASNTFDLDQVVLVRVKSMNSGPSYFIRTEKNTTDGESTVVEFIYSYRQHFLTRDIHHSIHAEHMFSISCIINSDIIGRDQSSHPCRDPGNIARDGKLIDRVVWRPPTGQPRHAQEVDLDFSPFLEVSKCTIYYQTCTLDVFEG